MPAGSSVFALFLCSLWGLFHPKRLSAYAQNPDPSDGKRSLIDIQLLFLAQVEPVGPTVLHQYAEQAAPSQASQPQEAHYQEQTPAYAPAAEQAYHNSQPELRQMQVANPCKAWDADGQLHC